MRMQNQKNRLIGLDVLRILSMMLITIRHFIGYAGLSGLVETMSVNGILIALLNVLCGSAVNIFVLISGYFLVDSHIKWNRMLKIWAETFFYSVVCFALSLVLGAEKLTSGKLLLSFFPFLTRHYWFTVAYLALCLVAPLLNKLIKGLSEKEFSLVVVGGGLLLSVWTSVVFFSEGVLTGGNTGLLWFVYLYFVGAFLKKRWDSLPKKSICACGIVGITAFLTVYQILSKKVVFLQSFNWLEDDSIFELLLSVLLFVLFLRINIKAGAVQKGIVALARCSFGVYLIQESCMLRQWLWQKVVCAQNYAGKWYLLPIAVAVVLILFMLAFIANKVFLLIFDPIEKRAIKAIEGGACKRSEKNGN